MHRDTSLQRASLTTMQYDKPVGWCGSRGSSCALDFTGSTATMIQAASNMPSPCIGTFRVPRRLIDAIPDSSYLSNSQCDLDDVFLLDLQMGPSPSLEPDPIWILVSRHFDKPVTDEFLGLHAYEDAPLVASRSLRPLPMVSTRVSLPWTRVELTAFGHW